MNHSIRRTAALIGVAALWVMGAAPVVASDSGTVDVQLDVASPCLIASPNIVDLGTLPIGDLSGTDTAISYTNCSVVAERVFGRVTDAAGTGGVTWTPADFGFDPATGVVTWCPGIGLNRYALVLSRLAKAPATGREGKSLAIADRELDTVPPDGTGAYDRLGVVMPCAGSNGGGATMSLQVTFTATF